MISVIIRTLNEATHLDHLIKGIKSQELDVPVEIIVVDSGSTDGSIEIARAHHCRVINIAKSDFTFGRSLNLGCDAADGDYIVVISGHCVPYNDLWMRKLVAPLQSGEAAYTYGRQIGGEESRFSEHQIFSKYFPADERLAQGGFFCNNANAAIQKCVFIKYRFNEELTGLEDMELAKKIMDGGGNIQYVSDATVFHLHNETWQQIRRRYEREAIALQHIMPEVHLHFFDSLRFYFSAVLLDMKIAASQKGLWSRVGEIVAFRFMQFLGGYRGNKLHRQLSRKAKERYFYPDVHVGNLKSQDSKHGAAESVKHAS